MRIAISGGNVAPDTLINFSIELSIESNKV